MTQLDNVFDEYQNIYKHILKHLYPALDSTGFTERNLTVNFINAYKKIYGEENCIAWFEFPCPCAKENHYDAILINKNTNEIFVIEAKRFCSEKKKNAVAKDIERIKSFYNNLLKENKKQITENREPRIKVFDEKNTKIYGIILADVWTKTDNQTHFKNAIYNNFSDEEYFQEFDNTTSKYLCSKEYVYRANDGTEEYHLLGFCWDIKRMVL